MKKPRTSGQLVEQLDEDLVWRLQEISSLRRAIASSDGVNQTALLRASVPVLYAHWEGYIKASSIRYAYFLSGTGRNFGDLNRSFAGLSALGQVKTLHSITKRVFVASDLLEALVNIDLESAIIPLDNYISNIGNLNSDMFEQIASFLSIDPSPYLSDRNLIDEELLKQRNDIAHGSYIFVDEGRFSDLSDKVLALMRQFKNDVQNAAALKSYLRATTTAAAGVP